MTDAIQEEDEKIRSKRMKHIQEYQQHAEEIEKNEDKPVGSLLGKAVHHISSEHSSATNLFQRLKTKNPQ